MMRRALLRYLAGLPLVGDGLVRPVNAPATATPPVGVQAGVSQAVVTANRVIVFGANGGVFVYNGTPAHGNPPVAALSAAATDPYGNSLQPGDAPAGGGLIVIGTGNAYAKLIAEGVPFPGLFLGTGDASETNSGYVESEVTGSGGTRQLVTTVASPSFGALPAVLNLLSQSEDTTVPGGFQFLNWPVTIDANTVISSTGILTAAVVGTSLDVTGNAVVSGTLELNSGAVIKFGAALDTDLYRLGVNSLATDGAFTVFGAVTATGGTAAAPTLITTDTWHNIALSAGFAAGAGRTPQVRLYAGGDVRLRGEVTLTAVAAAGVQWGTLPAASYESPTQQSFVTPTSLSGFAAGGQSVNLPAASTALQTGSAGGIGNAIVLDGIFWSADS